MITTHTKTLIDEILANQQIDVYEYARRQLILHYQSLLETNLQIVQKFEQQYQMNYEQFCEKYLALTMPNLYENELVAMDWESAILLKNNALEKLNLLQN